METALILTAALLGWLATIVGLHQSWRSEPFSTGFVWIYRLHHDHLRGPLWFHRSVNRIFILTRPLRLDDPSGSVAARSEGALRKRHNLAWFLATSALILVLIQYFI